MTAIGIISVIGAGQFYLVSQRILQRRQHFVVRFGNHIQTDFGRDDDLGFSIHRQVELGLRQTPLF